MYWGVTIDLLEFSACKWKLNIAGKKGNQIDPYVTINEFIIEKKVGKFTMFSL